MRLRISWYRWLWIAFAASVALPWAGCGSEDTPTTSTGTTTGPGAGPGGAGGSGGAGGTGGAGGDGGAGGSMASPDPSAGIGWAGDWGALITHGCLYTPGLPDPVTFDRTGVGHDCMIITADVWVPGLTEVDGNAAMIRAEVWSDITGAFAAESLSFHGRVGNNYRYSWNPLIYHPYAPPGSYSFWVRFSAQPQNIGHWYTIGLGSGPDGGAARTLSIVP